MGDKEEGVESTVPGEDDWANYLTPELEKIFRRQGRYQVEQEVLSHPYSTRKKRLAAMVWLARQRRRDAWLRSLALGLGILVTIGAALGGAYLGARENFLLTTRLDEIRAASNSQILVDGLIGEIEATMEIEANRRKALDPLLNLMVEMNALREAGGRPWLMPPVPARFPVYEANVTQLGLLRPPLARAVSTFYGYSYELRSHINLVTGPSILWANTPERERAVQEYRDAHVAWKLAANRLLSDLHDCCPKLE